MEIVNNGMGDVKFQVDDQIIYGVKSILSYNNCIIKQLIQKNGDSDDAIVLDPCITIQGFHNLLIYYGLQNPIITKDNLVDTIITSLYFDEEQLFNSCKQFFISNIDDNLLNEMCLFLPKLNPSPLIQQFKDCINEYIESNNICNLNEGKCNSLELLNYMLDITDLEVPNEDYLLDLLFNLYYESIKQNPSSIYIYIYIIML